MANASLIKLKCKLCKRINYYTTKNKKTVVRKLAFSKFCNWCRKHTTHQESRR